VPGYGQSNHLRTRTHEYGRLSHTPVILDDSCVQRDVLGTYASAQPGLASAKERSVASGSGLADTVSLHKGKRRLLHARRILTQGCHVNPYNSSNALPGIKSPLSHVTCASMHSLASVNLTTCREHCLLEMSSIVSRLQMIANCTASDSTRDHKDRCCLKYKLHNTSIGSSANSRSWIKQACAI
jgi:hypothetical protein